jgi:hypothetical protein
MRVIGEAEALRHGLAARDGLVFAPISHLAHGCGTLPRVPQSHRRSRFDIYAA